MSNSSPLEISAKIIGASVIADVTPIPFPFLSFFLPRVLSFDPRSASFTCSRYISFILMTLEPKIPNPFTVTTSVPPAATMVFRRRVLLVVFPAQGHINPALQFAKRLIREGVAVTFATGIATSRRMDKTVAVPDGLTFAAYSDGYDDGLDLQRDDVNHYMSELKRCGTETLTEFIEASIRDGVRFSFLVHTLLIPWAAEVARGFHIPSALLWIQPATVLSINYYYFNGFADAIRSRSNDPSSSVALPGLPLLTSRDLPSFYLPSNQYAFALPSFQEELEELQKGQNRKIFVNTFAALEPEGLTAIADQLKMTAIGPLIPSVFLDGRYPSDTSFGGDLFKRSRDSYIQWLNEKPKSSVVYVSFGSVSVFSKIQMEEIARGLIGSRRPFLWVIRSDSLNDVEEREEEKLRCIEELERVGMIVRWCSQVEVLSHPSVGCFLTHCGWNSTLECVASGVPVVAFPQWMDQATNAKLVQDVWKTGLRVGVNGEGVAEAGEIKRCLEIVMGSEERGREMRRNAKKWRELAVEAVKEGGTSEQNIKAFADEIESVTS